MKMKTFDLAVKYLEEAKIDFTHFDLYTESSDENEMLFQEQIEESLAKYLADRKNNYSNDYYKRTVFAAALYHFIFKKQGLVSFVDVVFEIIDTHENILNTNFEKYSNTIYPKIMVDAFYKYCSEMKPQPIGFSEKSEVRFDFFCAVYHYVLD